LIKIARDTGVSGYVGEGANHWPAGHVPDIGRLYRLAPDKAPAGAQLYGAAEQGITVREIAETIGRRLDLPAVSIPAEQAADHFKAFPFITLGITMPNAETRQLPADSAAGNRALRARRAQRGDGVAGRPLCLWCRSSAQPHSGQCQILHIVHGASPCVCFIESPGWFVHLSLPTSLLHIA
jgi:hypothetical protein